MFKRLLNKIESIYRYRYLSKNKTGAYDFLLKKIYKSTDIDFLENIWKLDYYREILEPQDLEINNLNKVLVLAPHQDDETLGCGGTLLKLKENNCDITIGFLTNGSELSNSIDSKSIRKKEAKSVCNMLNSTMLELKIDNITMSVQNEHFDTLIKWLNKDWDAIFTIWPIDQPPKHRICSYLLGKAINESDYKGNILFYSVHTDLLPNFYVDITDVIDKKQDLLSCYTSQLEVQRYDHLSRGLDAWRSRLLPVSNKLRYIETFMQIPVNAYSDFQQIYEEANTNKLFKANETCINSFNRLKKF